nr:1159_t:CDS:2 [Entrophospora candida]CAG8536707.1 12223_t:CDS:2 [Entrophospora candida]
MNLEWEVGKKWETKYGTKFLKELGLKSPKNPKDMLVKLMEKVSWNPTQCDKIQTIGIIHSGFMIMVYLDRPKGYICRIKRSETMEVPDSPEKFPSILHILDVYTCI